MYFMFMMGFDRPMSQIYIKTVLMANHSIFYSLHFYVAKTGVFSIFNDGGTVSVAVRVKIVFCRDLEVRNLLL